MSLEAENNNFRFVDKAQNKIRMNTLYGFLAFPLTNNSTELENLKSELNTEMQIYQMFFKPVKHKEN